ncbi:DUF4416 family protein [bacterium]|nr:DUF4416 family protein [bacterium]
MAEAYVHDPVAFFIGVIVAKNELLFPLRAIIESSIGKIAFESEILQFDEFTHYYKPEMGEGLLRVWMALEGIRPPESLIRLKWACTAIENHFKKEGKRRVNLDPGYLTLAKVILATFKNFSHRIYLGDGVFADLQLMYRRKEFVPMEWTFADYRSEGAQRFFLMLRESYKKWLKSYKNGQLEPITGW